VTALFRKIKCEDGVKILIASTPATGHLNPLLTIGRILIAEGHEVVGLSGSAFREPIQDIGAEFRPLPGGADFDLRDLLSVVPELKNIPPGPEWLRVAIERVFVDTIPAQHKGLQQVLRDFTADIIIGDNMILGVLPMLLGPRSKRPSIVLCGTSILHWRREDGAPHFLGLPPATTQAQLKEYAAISREHDRVVNQPLARRLEDLGVGPLSMTVFDAVVELADAYMQLTVPSFEFPRNIPPSVHFIGALPIVPNRAPLPAWANELDGSRKVILVTQGTLANHNFGLLIAPTLAALANEPDLLVVVTAGGRPIDAIPDPIPSNARLASYLPFEWMLPKVDVFVTNGGYGSVNQAMSFGIPLVTAGLTEDKADVNARVAWSGVGIDLGTNEPSPQALREAVPTVLDKPNYRWRAWLMAEEFDEIDARSEILRIVSQVSHIPDEDGLRRSAVAENNSIQAHLNANHLAPID
jgi:UDP:flavonoid glycosyltransferase YjiC (YdhE family)